MNPSIQSYEISHRHFSTHFKLIRHEKDLHFGEYLLMRNSQTRRRVAVKSQPYSNPNELQIILADMNTLLRLNQCPHICEFLGYVLEQTHNQSSIYLIYDYHQATLEEQTKAMNLHNEKFTQKELITFIKSIFNAFSWLQENGLNHMCVSSDYILIENRGNIDMMFRLLLTPFISGSYEQISQFKTNVEDYNLSQTQLYQMKQQTPTKDLSLSDKLKSDKQSLGLLSLRLATLPNQSRFYEMNDHFHLTWNSKGINQRLIDMNNNYSKDLCTKIEYLIFENIFHGFKGTSLPELDSKQHSITKSRIGSSRKLNTSFPIGRSGISVSSKKSPKQSRMRSNDEHLKKFKWDSISHSKSTLREISPDRSKRQIYENQLKRIEDHIFGKLSEHKLKYYERAYGDGGKYVGGLIDDKREGYGLYYFQEGDVYGGEWKNDQIIGKGTYLFVAGEIYEGDVMSGLKHGNGRYRYSNGNVYDGQWNHDKKDGFGTFYYYSKGQTYQGNFNKGYKEGKGTYTWNNGDKFVGLFKNGTKNGHGTLSKANGSTIKGEWRNDQMVGIITVSYRSGIEITSEIRDGELYGQATQKAVNGFNFQGHYQNNRRNGHGKVQFVNGDSYVGNFQNGFFDGMGDYYYSHQKVHYKGEWKEGLQHGKGRLHFPNGTFMALDWIKGVPQPKGMIQYKNGDNYEGMVGGKGPDGRGVYRKRTGEEVEGEFRNGFFGRK